MKTKYCRACGEGKGHNSDKCKNAAALRECLDLTDQELETAMGRASRAEDDLKAAKTWEPLSQWQSRIISALLNLAEAKRAPATER